MWTSVKMKSARANLDTCLLTAANVLQAITRILVQTHKAKATWNT